MEIEAFAGAVSAFTIDVTSMPLPFSRFAALKLTPIDLPLFLQVRTWCSNRSCRWSYSLFPRGYSLQQFLVLLQFLQHFGAGHLDNKIARFLINGSIHQDVIRR